ncbi:hypothetical protein TNIN_39431 [Trichonephila inaurata madagascariensis]|uniref:Winged helix-turn helix domain-containing protein n=1 Tax=Trichonephila inaurata madagascariensis TaxID=2747483 RepID=A0A8X6Y7A1_9ARAC|nr:hypothetical protein TNIN_39431 [Trichonephila inaurata madagascariensis]
MLAGVATNQELGPELMELLIMKLEKFEEKFNEILKVIPIVNSTRNKVFFLYFFIGGVVALPYTNLWNECGIEEAYWDCDFENSTIYLHFLTLKGNKVSIQANIEISDSEHSKAEFKKIEMDENDVENWYKVCCREKQISLEEILKEEASDAERVEKLFKRLGALYCGIDGEGLKDYGCEAAQHGFACGVLILCCKRYLLDYYIEPTAGRGYADLILSLRKQNSETILVVAEFKSRNKDHDTAKKQVENQGYFYHHAVLAVLEGEEQNVVVACASFLHQRKKILVYEKKVSKPASIVRILYEIYKAENKGKELTTSLEKLVEGMYYSISNCESKNDHSFSRLILANHLLEDQIIKQDIRQLSMHALVCQSNGGITLLLKMNRNNKAIILNIVDVPGKETRNSRENYMFPSLISHGIDSVLKVDIVVKRRDADNFPKVRTNINLNEKVDGKCSRHVLAEIMNTISIEEVEGLIEGDTKFIGKICDKLQETVVSIDYNSRRIEQQNTIAVITNEATFKALIHGLMIINNSKYLALSESNILSNRRADLIIYDSEKKVVLVVFELKYHGSLEEAVEQMEEYLDNSEYKEITRICLNWNKKSEIESIFSLSKPFFSTDVKIAKENQEHVMKAIKILEIIAFCTEKEIPIRLFLELNVVERKSLESVLYLVDKSLLVERDTANILIKDGAALQEVKVWLEKTGREEKIFGQIYKNLESVELSERSMPHLEMFLQYIDKLLGEKRLCYDRGDGLASVHESLGKVYSNIASLKRESNQSPVNDYDKAIKHFKEMNNINDPSTLSKERFGLDISKSTVHRNMQRMKFSYITPRPVHNGQDKSKQEEFKKKSQRNYWQISRKRAIFL